jgi:glycosyltransferase involved in cell wall biosynthesis
MKKIEQIFYISFRPKTNNFMVFNNYDFPLEAGGLNKSLLQDFDILAPLYKLGLIIFDYRSKDITSKGINCYSLKLFSFINFLLFSNEIKDKRTTLFVLKGTIGLGLIIKLLCPASHLIIVIEPPFKVLAWVTKNRTIFFSIAYFICSIVSIFLAEKLIVDSKNNWTFRTKIKTIRNKTIFLPNSIDTSLFYPNYLRDNKKNKELLYVGRLSHWEQKNPDLLFKAFELLANDIPNINLTVISDSIERMPMVIKNKNILNKIRFIPGCPANDLIPYYRNSDLTLLTSFFEGTPYVILESLACGTPCISTNILEKDLIINDTNGFICSTFSEMDFSNTVKLGLQLAERIKEKNISLLNPIYDLKQRNKNLLSVINSL